MVHSNVRVHNLKVQSSNGAKLGLRCNRPFFSSIFCLSQQPKSPISNHPSFLYCHQTASYSRFGNLKLVIWHYSRIIFEPPVTTESWGRFESGFGHFEAFRKKIKLGEVKIQNDHRQKWPSTAILKIPKSAIFWRFYSKSTVEVSILTNLIMRNPFQGLVCFCFCFCFFFFKFWPSLPWNSRWPPFYL